MRKQELLSYLLISSTNYQFNVNIEFRTFLTDFQSVSFAVSVFKAGADWGVSNLFLKG